MVKITAIIFTRGEDIRNTIISCLQLCNSFIIIETMDSNIENWLSQENINGTVHRVKWINYEYNYNEALLYSRKKMFPHTDYFMWIESNEVVESYFKGKIRPARGELALSVNINDKYREVRLFTPGFNCQFKGYAYPRLICNGRIENFRGLSINRDESITLNRVIENRELLYMQIMNSEDTNIKYNWNLPLPCDYKFIDDRTLFYIGYCSYLMGDNPIAAKVLKDRIKWTDITGVSEQCQYEKWYSKVIMLRMSTFDDNKLLSSAISLYEKSHIDDLSYSYIKDNSLKDFIVNILARNGRNLLIQQFQ